MARETTKKATKKATRKAPEKATKKTTGNSTGSSTRTARTSTQKRTGKSTGTSTGKRGQKSTQPTRKPTEESTGDRTGEAPRTEAARRPRATQIAARAAQELLELTGRDVEGITGLERADDGWTVQVEVVEVHRIPDTTDVLALYEVQTDASGSLQGYRRLRRYARGTPGEE